MKSTRLVITIVNSATNHDDNPRLVYIMQAWNQTTNLRSKNINHCDKGAISIGSLISLLCLLLIWQ